MAYVTWRYLNHLKWNSFQCLEIDFCLAQKTEPKAWIAHRPVLVHVSLLWPVYSRKKYIFGENVLNELFFCRVTKNESNEIIIFWIESIISKSAPEITWKT